MRKTPEAAAPEGFIGTTWAALKDGVAQIGETKLALISAGVGFFGMLSLFPAMAALIAVMSLLSDPDVVLSLLEELKGLLPHDVYEIFRTQIVSLVTTSPEKLGWAGVISISAALWTARAGVAAMMTGLNAVHGAQDRATIRHYIRALLLTLALVAVSVVALITLVVAPVVLAFFPLGGTAGLIVETLRWTIAVVVLLAGVGVLYKFGTNRGVSHRRSIKSGAVVAVVSWAILSVIFSYYVANFGNYNRVYGSIGAVIAMLVWLWLSSYLILLGAVVNVQVEKYVYKVKTPDSTSPFEDLPKVPASEIVDGTPASSLP